MGSLGNLAVPPQPSCECWKAAQLGKVQPALAAMEGTKKSSQRSPAEERSKPIEFADETHFSTTGGQAGLPNMP